MSDRQVARFSGKCADCAREFQESDDFFAVLGEGDEGFERVDHCPECWPKVKDQGLIFWKTRVPVREEKKRTFVDDAVLVEFFRRLADAEEPQRQRFRFVLALVMMRKRLLRYVRSTRRKGTEYWRVILMADKREYLVLDPQLSEEQIAELSAQLGQILNEDPDEQVEGDGDENGAGEPQTTEAGDPQDADPDEAQEVEEPTPQEASA